jgi:zinc D-Ala-D-Ala carboxypeptidase
LWGYHSSSPDYIRWVQRSLNQILGLRLAVDGILGPQTRSAIRSFQSKYGLAVDGIVGPQTERTLISAGAGSPSGGSAAPTYPRPVPPAVPVQSPTYGSSRAQLALRILNSGRIELWPYSPTETTSSDGADALSNIRDTAAGKAARNSSYKNAPGGSVYLDQRLLAGMLQLANTYTFRVTSIAGGSHSKTSRHYVGVACDVDMINGVEVSSSNPYYREFMQKCRDLGATEVLGPGDKDHSTHVHFTWPRP